MGDIADFSRGEPAPIPNDGPSMHDLAVTDIMTALGRSTGVPDSELAGIIGVCDELDTRRAHGLTKYGTILQANNGRNATRDALDEALDLIVYMRQIITEQPELHGVNLDSMYRNAIEFAIALKYLLLKSETANDTDSSAAEAGSSDLERGQHRTVQEVPGEEEGQLHNH